MSEPTPLFNSRDQTWNVTAQTITTPTTGTGKLTLATPVGGGVLINNITNATNTNALFYNTTTKEITYSASMNTFTPSYTPSTLTATFPTNAIFATSTLSGFSAGAIISGYTFNGGLINGQYVIIFTANAGGTLTITPLTSGGQTNIYFNFSGSITVNAGKYAIMTVVYDGSSANARYYVSCSAFNSN